jgi:hypothetical protein
MLDTAAHRRADIEHADGGHKKTRYKTGLLIIGSGGVICAVPTVPQRVRLR